jgi:acyl-CoA synthetase (AMP-forming)/AMP-acid ligase II
VSGRLAEELTRAIRGGKRFVTGANEALAGGDVDALASRVADALISRGVVLREPVHAVIDNRPGDLSALLGIWRAGAVAVPVHVSTPLPALQTLQAATGARFSICRDVVEEIGGSPPRTARCWTTPP